MQGIIANYRGSRRRKRGNYMLVNLPKIDSREKAEALTGKNVEWTAPGKEKKVLKGKITGAHGNSGVVKVLFETGMPGQSLGKEVKIV